MIVLVEKEDIAMNPNSVARSIRRYIGKVQTLRNQVRTERFLNALPGDIRKDIGWPDRFGEASRNRRRGI